MNVIFDFVDYKEFVRTRQRESPQGGRGQYLRMARAATMQSSNLSSVFNGDKHLTLEQAESLARFFELSEAESDYFLLMVSYARAGTVELRNRLNRQLEAIRSESKKLVSRLPADRSLSDAEKAIFYSNWYYSAIHILAFIPEFQTVDAISKRLRLSRSTVESVVSFLINQGLLIESAHRLSPSTKHTHLDATSPLIARHHSNWRVKAMERFPRFRHETELSYSSQLTLSTEDVPRIRSLCVEFIQSVRKLIDPSPSQAAYCLNLDWFELF